MTQNKYKVIVSEKAARMLVEYAVSLADVSPKAAEKLVDSFEKAAESLEIMPLRCARLRGEYIPQNKYRFIVFENEYIIIFQIIDDTVYADYVVNTRQDYGWLVQ